MRKFSRYYGTFTLLYIKLIEGNDYTVFQIPDPDQLPKIQSEAQWSSESSSATKTKSIAVL